LQTTAEILPFDVVIIGGGPAGTATALSLIKHRPSLSIAIVEGSQYEGLRIGETLAPIAQPLLGQLEVWERFSNDNHLAAYGACSAWGSDELLENEFIYYPHNRGWHLDRRAFDRMLAEEACERGVTLYTGCTLRNSGKSADGRWRLTLEGKDKLISRIAATFVVDATGRRAVFARGQGARKERLDQLLGVFVFFRQLGEQPLADSYTLVEACEEGWWYSALIPDAGIVVAFMSDADIVKNHGLKSPPRWFEAMCKTRYIRGRLNRVEPLTRPAVQAAYSHRLDRVTGDGWLAVGDAATTFDPLSSQGIFKALRSGILASYAILDYFKGNPKGLERYAAAVTQEYESYLETRLEYYGQERRWPDSPFWQRRHASVDHQ
jgi:flavin-dependent dehydrogenase